MCSVQIWCKTEKTREQGKNSQTTTDLSGSEGYSSARARRGTPEQPAGGIREAVGGWGGLEEAGLIVEGLSALLLAKLVDVLTGAVLLINRHKLYSS